MSAEDDARHLIRDAGYDWQFGGEAISTETPGAVLLVHWLLMVLSIFDQEEADFNREIENLQRKIDALQSKKRHTIKHLEAANAAARLTWPPASKAA